MATFILMTKLAPEVAAKMNERAEIGSAWLDEVHKKCPEVKFLAHYGLLGAYDFMDIYEAPNEEIAAKVSMISRQHGAVSAESWTAIPYKKVLELSQEL